MTNLKCTVTNCGYNKDNNCCKESIVVEGVHAQNPSATSCMSFVYKDDMSECNKRPNCNMDIECSAETCIFNKQGCCDAKEICVGGAAAKTEKATECDSFVKSK